MTSSSSKPILCDEIFDENSVPSEQEVRDYALKIGINPDTEKHLLNIALDGLMSPLPADWKPCLDERVNRIYYLNVKNQKTQWSHPLDEHFENIVKKRRQEESISAGDDDSKTSIKEDLKSFEEAVTISDMLPPRSTFNMNKSKPTTIPLKSPSQAAKDPSPDGRRALNPIGRPPLPPKRRAGSVSPKRGGMSGQSERSSLSLRLSPGPSLNRIDIDSIGVPVGLPSPELKSDKQPASRSPAIKLTGGGSAFLKSRQKQTPSPSDESKPTPEESSFEIVREADSIDCLEEDIFTDSKISDGRKLKHSMSLGESGFDVLTKSSRFTSLQESLLSLKNEMDLTNKDAKSPNTSAPLALRSILREKPSPTTRLWDVDPLLLTSEEKEKLRVQEMKEERKQNVRFADIVHKPINIRFSKSDSEDDSNTNNSSDDLDDLILEQMCSDDELKKESKFSESFQKVDAKTGLDENSRKGYLNKSLRESLESSLEGKERNKNILSRLTDLNTDTENKYAKEDKESRIIGIENNNKEEREGWLTDQQNIMNYNEQKTEQHTKELIDNTKLVCDTDNNALEKEISNMLFAKSLDNKNENLFGDQLSSPKKLAQLPVALEKELYDPSEKAKDSPSLETTKHRIIRDDSTDNAILKPAGDFCKSKLMPEMDLQKVFQSVRESIMHAEQEQGLVGEAEPMQITPEDIEEAPGDTGATHKWEKHERHKSKRFQDYHDQQKKLYEDKKDLLQQEHEENLYEMQKELMRQESLEKERLYMEVQQSVAKYKQELDAEKNEREAQLRNQCEEFLKDLEEMLSKEKELKVTQLKEDFECFMKEQEKKTSKEKTQIEEESKMRLSTSSSQLEKIIAEFRQKEDIEIRKLKEENNKRLVEIRQQIDLEQIEKEKKHKQELAIVEAEYERILAEKREEVEKARTEHEVELAALRSQHEETLNHLTEQHRQTARQIQDQCHMEEEFVRRKHSEKMEVLNAQLNRVSDKEDFTQVNREFEKVRCEKRLLEDKYKSLKEKYMRLKNEVRLSMERKRQAKLNRQLQQRDPSTTEDTTDRSTDHGKPPLSRRKQPTITVSSDEANGDNPNGTPKTIKRRPKPPISATTSSATVESSSLPPAKPKNVWIPSPQLRREGASSAEDNHTSVSEEIQLEHDEYGEKWTQSALSPLENLRKQLEKLDDLEEQFPTSVHTDTYLRYPFSGPGQRHTTVLAGGGCELDFYRHRLHLERESVRRAKQALSEQRINIESRQMLLRHKQHNDTIHHVNQEERELTDMEVSLHRTKALLGEKIIRLRHLEQSIERAATLATHAPDTSAANTDSSGFSGSDMDISNRGGQVRECISGRSEAFWTENVLHSLENINSEIREIWTILGKQQTPGMGPPPVVQYESRAIGLGDSYALAPHRATDIADRTRRLKEWLIRTRDQQSHTIVPVPL